MRMPGLMFLLAACAGTIGIAWLGAVGAVGWVERATTDTLSRSLEAGGHEWATIEADGLEVRLGGTAPSESARFRALEVAAQLVDTDRISNEIVVSSAATEDTPNFTLEILRNGRKLSLMGLLPGARSRLQILSGLEQLIDDAEFTDLAEAVEFPAPDGWDRTITFAIDTAHTLEQSRVLVVPGSITVEAYLESEADVGEVEAVLKQTVPRDLDLTISLDAPKPIMAPFRFAAAATDGKVRVTTCAAESNEGIILIETALSGVSSSRTTCALAVGAPSPEWPEAVVAAIEALAAIGDGQITFSDADVRFVAAETADPAAFDKAARDLKSTLPALFSLKSVAPSQPDAANAPARRPSDFTATLDVEGNIMIKGALRDETARDAVRHFAAARFGASQVQPELTVDASVPDGWSGRIFAILDAMTLLQTGEATISLTRAELSGHSHVQDVRQRVERTFSDRLSDMETRIDVSYSPEPEDTIRAPSAKECERQLASIMQAGQIVFAPNSAKISDESEIILDEIAFVIKSCPDARFEIGGHTDSQGRESMNLALSQARSDSVLDSLLAREVMLASLVARGYGEQKPIGDNETEAGRAANRRIEFRLLRAIEAEEEEGVERGDVIEPETEEERADANEQN